MPKRINYSEVIEQHLKILSSLRTPTGLFRAAAVHVDTGYDKAWLRDNFYECLAYLDLQKWSIVIQTYNALLEIFLKHEYKIDHAIANKPDAQFKYIHARYHPDNFSEFWDEWGNKQNDAVGAILYMIGELEITHKQRILDTEDKKRIVQKLINYLQTLEYWHDSDNGVWEAEEEVHASSVGACLAGLKSISRLEYLIVNQELIVKGEEKLNDLLPRESIHKFVDLALLSLIYPYNVVSKEQERQILENVEYHLVREKGVIRYKNDYYYNKNQDGFSEEAEWCFGLSWLALIYSKLSEKDKAERYMKMAFNTINAKGEIPELYFSNSDEYNGNSPLGWAESLFIVALYEYQKKSFKL